MSADDFSIRINGKKTPALPYALVFSSLKDPEWEPPESAGGKEGKSKGGISTGEDAVEFLMAGATAVQVGTATFANPRAPLDVLEGLERWLGENGVGSVREIIGCAVLR